MAKITQITANYGVTKNIGNYESLRLDITLSATIENGDDVDKEWQKLMDIAREKLIESAETEESVLKGW